MDVNKVADKIALLYSVSTETPTPFDLAKEIVNNIDTDWTDPYQTFLDPSCGRGTFLLALLEKLQQYHSREHIVTNMLYGADISKVQSAIATKSLKLLSGVKPNISTCDSLTERWNMKFDNVIGNPPYQDKKGNEDSTNSADLYAKFVEKSFNLVKDDGQIALVIPSAWSGPKNSNLKTLLFETHQPSVFDTHGKKWFPVNMNTCYFITKKFRKGTTTVTDAHNNKVKVKLNKNSVVGLNLNDIPIMEKMKSFSEKANLGEIWLRGHIHLNQVDDVKTKKGVELILSVGSYNTGLENTAIIDSKAETTGYDKFKLVIPNMGSSDTIGNIKIATKKQVGGHSVVFLVTKTEAELENLKNYLESKLIRFLISAVKISTPNSKTVFSNIPMIDFTKKWSDDELYNYFGLQDKREYIESNVK